MLPNQFVSAISNNPRASLQRWIEIEGIPTCYGSVTLGSGWFSSRAATDKFLAVKPYLTSMPDNFDAELDVFEGLAKTMGQATFKLSDYDGEPTKWAGNAKKTDWVYLSADLTKTATSFTYTGTASTIDYPTGGGTLYLGAETMTYTSHNVGTKTFSGIVRGMYRSKPTAFGLGFPVAPRPYTMYGRRLWYYQTAQADIGAAPTDADKVLRFVGTLSDFYLDGSDRGAYVIEALSIEKELSRSVFRDLRTFKDSNQKGISAPPWDEPGVRPQAGVPGATTGSDRWKTPDGSQLAASEVVFLLIDDEVISFQRESGTYDLVMQQRGCFNTKIDSHKPGFTAKEVGYISRPDSTSFPGGPAENWASKFSSSPTTASPLPADHPLLVLLSFLLSTGTGTNFVAGKRNYDKLPANWGLGIDVARVDVASFEAMAAEEPGLRAGGFSDKELKFPEVAKQFLAPFGFYMTTLIGDVLTCRKFRPPLPEETVRSIDNSSIINKSNPGWSANWSGAVQTVIFNHSYDRVKNRYSGAVWENFADAKLFVKDLGQRKTFNLDFIYDAALATPGCPRIGGTPNLELVLVNRKDFYKQGFARPPPIVTARLKYSYLDLAPGDVVVASFGILPSAGSGLRGIVNGVMRVLKSKIDERSKTVEVTLIDTGYNLDAYRRIGPSLQVESIPVAGTYVFAANAFTDASLGETDDIPLDSQGNQDPWVQTQLDEVGDFFVVAKDFSNWDSVTPTSYDWTTRTIVAAGVPWLAVGDYFMLDYGLTCGSLLPTYAFAVDADLLFSDGSPANRYFP